MHQTLATVGCAVSERVTAQDGGRCRKVGVRREGSPQGGEEEGVRGEGLRPLAPVGLSDHCEAWPTCPK